VGTKKDPSETTEQTDTNTRPAVPAHGREQAQRNRAYLVVLAGTRTGEMFKLPTGERVVIGRGMKSFVRLTDDGISREHAALAIEGDKVLLEDLGSTNGTFCNGARVENRELVDGDKIMVGSTTILKFTYHDYLDEVFQRQMYESALRDGLTKAYNRKYLGDLLEKEIAFSLRHGSPLSLLFIDIDHFKQVNDTAGHSAGDYVLAEVAKTLAAAIRTEDALARFGGEEFCVLCRGTDREGGRMLAERLRRSIADRRFTWEGRALEVTISVGGAALPDLALRQPALLLAAADRALYEAKHAGRNCVVIARASTEETSPDKR
jgi:two-component system cell cycle response regulator